MSGETLKVNPQVLQSAAAAFGEVVDALARIEPDVPIGDAATAAGQLRIADSCRNAQAGVAAAVTTAIESVRKYGDNLGAAARAYLGEDVAGTATIANVDIPS